MSNKITMQNTPDKSEIDRLPVEALEIIFNVFSSLIDLQHCYNTCTKWRKIITAMFKDNCKYMHTYLIYSLA